MVGLLRFYSSEQETLLGKEVKGTRDRAPRYIPTDQTVWKRKLKADFVPDLKARACLQQRDN